MTDVKDTTDTQKQATDKDLLDALKSEALELGVKFHPATGLAKLQQLVMDHKAIEQVSDDSTKTPEKKKKEKDSYDSLNEEAKKRINIENKRREATKLIRVAISCMDSNKSQWDGDIYKAGNSIIPSIKMFIPYQSESWHLPKIMIDFLGSKKTQIINTQVDDRGRETIHKTQIPMFNIVELPALTEKEIETLKQAQLKKGLIDN